MEAPAHSLLLRSCSPAAVVLRLSVNVGQSVSDSHGCHHVDSSLLSGPGWMDGWMDECNTGARPPRRAPPRSHSLGQLRRHALPCLDGPCPYVYIVCVVAFDAGPASREKSQQSVGHACYFAWLPRRRWHGDGGARPRPEAHTHTQTHTPRIHTSTHTHIHNCCCCSSKLHPTSESMPSSTQHPSPSHHLPTGGDAESTHAPRTSWTAPAQYVPTHVLHTTSRRASCVFRTVTLAQLSQSTAAPVSRPSLHHSVSSHLGGTAQQHAPGQTFTPPRSPPRLPPDAAPCAWALYRPATWFLATSSARRGRHDASQPAPASVGLFGASTPGFASPSSRRVRAAVPPTAHIRTS